MTSELDNWKLPVDWELASIGNKFVFTRKPRGLRLENYERVPFIPMDRIPSDRLFFSDFALKPSSDITSGTYFEEGDLLVSKITPCFENGKQGIVRNIPGGFGIATTEVIPLKPIEGVSHLPFLAMYLLHRDIRTRLAGRMEGATGRQRLPKTVLEQWSMPFPPIAEQRAIADVLSKIQAAVEMQDKIVATLKELKAATMAKLFREGLRGESLKQTEIGEIPESWEVVYVGDLLTVELGKMLSPKSRRGVNPRLYLRNKNVQWGRFDLSDVFQMDFTDHEFERFRLKLGDILVCEGGEPGRTAVWEGEIPDCCYQKALHRLRPKDGKRVHPRYYLYWATAAFTLFRTHKPTGTKTTIAHLPKEKLEVMEMALPKLSEQKRIVEILDNVDCRLLQAETKASVLKSMFSSMLHLLMTGRVRVNHTKSGRERHGEPDETAHNRQRLRPFPDPAPLT